MPSTAWGNVNVLYDNESTADEHTITFSEDGKQVHCYIEARANQRYQIRAATLPFFKASVHVFIDGEWNEGRILSGGLSGTLRGRTVGENETQPFIFAPALIRDQKVAGTQEIDSNMISRAGSITVELWHVEIVGEANPVHWNSDGSQVVIPRGARDPNSLSHTTKFGEKQHDLKTGSSVMISRPIFQEPFLVVTFEYMSRELLQRKGLWTNSESPTTHNTNTPLFNNEAPRSNSVANVTPTQTPPLPTKRNNNRRGNNNSEKRGEPSKKKSRKSKSDLSPSSSLTSVSGVFASASVAKHAPQRSLSADQQTPQLIQPITNKTEPEIFVRRGILGVEDSFGELITETARAVERH